MDQLESFLDYYQDCKVIDQVQVIWSDIERLAPIDWLSRYPKNKIIFEIHKNNSLSNRFKQILPIQTEVRYYFILLVDILLICSL